MRITLSASPGDVPPGTDPVLDLALSLRRERGYRIVANGAGDIVPPTYGRFVILEAESFRSKARPLDESGGRA